MATKKISALTELTTPAGTEELIVNAGGTSKKLQIDNLPFSDISSKVSKTGDTMTGDLSLGDAVKATFGASDDLQIYHDGSHSYIQDNGTGDLRLKGNNIALRSNDDGDNYIYCVEEGAVTLYYHDVGKLATTSTGIDVTGAITTDGITEDSSGNVGIGTDDPQALLETSQSSSSKVFGLTVQNSLNTNSSATGIGIKFKGSSYSDADESRKYAAIYGVAEAEYHNEMGLAFYTNDDRTQDPTEKMRITSTGNVGIGVTPESWSSSATALQVGDLGGIWVYDDNSNPEQLHLSENVYNDGEERYIESDYASSHQQRSGVHTFKVAPSGTADAAISWTDAMKIENTGNIRFKNNLENSSHGVNIYPSSDDRDSINCKTSSTGQVGLIHFYNPNGLVGYIASNGTSTQYITSSDYRLKENVTPLTGSIDRLKELKPSKFNFIADAETTVDGFLAHEAQEVVPEAISGEKDAMRTEEYTVSEALGEVFTPAVEEVTEERQVTETVETGSYVNLAGETITETQEVGVTEEATETVIERQDIDGVMTEVEVEKVTQEPVMETVVTTQAVAEVIVSSNVEKPEIDVEGQQWRETTPAEMGEREVEDYQGIDQAKLVPLLVSALQEAVARIEQLENA